MKTCARSVTLYSWRLPESCRAVVSGIILTVAIITSAALAQETDDFFDANGVSIHYLDTGSGEPVVLMHGADWNYEMAWVDTGIVQALTDAGFRVLALDARAHGKSGAPHDPAQYGQEMSLDIARLLDHVGVEKAHMVGYSMGAEIVQKLRDLHPERFLSMCIGGLGWLQQEGATPGQLELAESLESGGGIMPFLRKFHPDWSDEEREAENKRALKAMPDPLATAARLRGSDFAVSEESIRTNTVPTLAIIGGIDPLKHTVDALDGVMPHLEIVVVPDADHGAAFRSPEYLANMLRFLREHTTRSAPQD